MAATVTKAGPYFASGEISFSSLRTNFKETSSGSISASELRRNTSVTDRNPIVPDATENASISTGNNLAISQFRNSIKYYYITQTGTNTNFDIGAQSWNSNLNKNILKWMYMNGAVGSSTSSAAAILSSTAHNLTIDVSGSILGSGGRGGGTAGAPAISGESGGNGLNINSSGANNIVVFVRNTANIYGGGGGGERGKTGANGADGTCNEFQDTGWHCQGNAAGQEKCASGFTFCKPGWRYCCITQGGGCAVAWWYVGCCRTTTKLGGLGGLGGKGGNGRGYQNQSGSTSGESGSPGQPGEICPSGNQSGENGKNGERGGDGGNYGESGQSTPNTGNGGASGRAISGSNYSVTGILNTNTIKGLYNP